MDSQPATTMSKEEYMALAEQKYHDLQQLKSKPTLYDYEKSFDELWQELGRQVFEKNLSEVPTDRRKKKDDDTLRSDTTGPPARSLTVNHLVSTLTALASVPTYRKSWFSSAS